MEVGIKYEKPSFRERPTMLVNLILGDCIEKAQLIPDKSVDLIIIDPPYKLRNSLDTSSKWKINKRIQQQVRLDGIDNGFDFESFCKIAQRILKRMNMFSFCSNAQISQWFNWGESNGYITTLLFWHKYNAIPFCNNTWGQDAELIIHIRESGATFNGNGRDSRKVYYAPMQQSRFGHPTEKPIALIEKFVRVCSNPDDTVADLFMGSGTTGVACVDNGRNFIGVEKNEKYFNSAKRRIENEQAKVKIW